MKKLFTIYLIFLGITTFVSGQDTIIERADFTLEVRKVTERTNPYEYVKTGENFEFFEYKWTNGNVREIVEDWMSFMELEEIEYMIDDSVPNRSRFIQYVSMEKYLEEYSKSDSISIRNIFGDKDVASVFMGYRVIYKRKNNARGTSIDRAAFELFCELLDLEITMVVQPITYWKLEIIDPANASISYDQNTHWKRTDTEEYIFYERIKYRRIADLLSRKLDAFVKPIPYDAQKFDIRMPYSDDVFDLKYAMIEHGLELIEVTEEIDIMIIQRRE